MPKNRLLSQLLHAWTPVPEEFDRVISGINLNTQILQAGDLFFALIGHKLDGRDFINDAIARGAVAVLSESEDDTFKFMVKKKIPVILFPQLSRYCSHIAAEFYEHPSWRMKVVGVTGTNGKTSSAFYIAAAFHALGKKTAIMGTIGCGVYGETLQDTGLTTADAITVQKTLSNFVEAGVEVVGMEVSSHALAQGRVKAVHFSAAIFTNLTHEHLDYHGTMEAYFFAKKILFEHLSINYAVINANDKYGKKLIKSFKEKQKLCVYGIELHEIPSKQFVVANHPNLSAGNIHAELHTSWGDGTCSLNQLGSFNLSNMLGVMSVMGLFEVPMEKILNVVRDLPAVPGRMQKIQVSNKPLLVIDFAHTPDALEKALNALKAIEHGKLWCIFGCGGGRDKAKRPMMAAIAEKLADHVIVTDDNPRDEDPEAIIKDILKGFKKISPILIEHDRRAAIEYAITHASVNDIILVAGKGHEKHQLIGKEVIHYSDLETVEELLRND